MKVTQITIGRFHHFHLARQLQKHHLLNEIWTGYPKFKLKDEKGIPFSKIKTYPWLQAPYMAKGKIGLGDWDLLEKELAWLAHNSLDKHVAKRITEGTHLIALSGVGLYSGKEVQRLGGKYICDRGSSHICYQNNILKEEHLRYGLKFKGIDSRTINKEEEEYSIADYISVPSEFVVQSFLQQGIKKEKIIKIPYGANLERFKKIAEIDRQKFRVLFVGNLSIQKGIIDLLRAFQLLKHPNKELIIVGSVTKEMKELIAKENTDNVIFKGILNNLDLPLLYSKSNVFVLPSIQEGLAMVQGESMACGCPVIATENTGGSDLFTNNIEGFIVPIRNPKAIADKLQLLADNPLKREEMSLASINKIKNIGGWNDYGNKYADIIKSLG
jgi:glycosyltransferase involved in cell wall biosynthesis